MPGSIDEAVEGPVELGGGALHGLEPGLLVGEFGAGVDLHVILELEDGVEQGGGGPDDGVARRVVEGGDGDPPSLLLGDHAVGDALDSPVRYHLPSRRRRGFLSAPASPPSKRRRQKEG